MLSHLEDNGRNEGSGKNQVEYDLKKSINKIETPTLTVPLRLKLNLNSLCFTVFLRLYAKSKARQKQTYSS